MQLLVLRHICIRLIKSKDRRTNEPWQTGHWILLHCKYSQLKVMGSGSFQGGRSLWRVPAGAVGEFWAYVYASMYYAAFSV